MFERSKRKNDDGDFLPYKDTDPCPIIDLKYPFYVQLEEFVTTQAAAELRRVADDEALAGV